MASSFNHSSKTTNNNNDNLLLSSNINQTTRSNINNYRHTILDRSVPIVLPNIMTNNESITKKNQNDNIEMIPPSLSRLHKLHGTSLIFESSKLLGLGASSYATACVIFHRFYASSCLIKHDVWSVAMAASLLATKLEEEPKTLNSIIQAYCHIYRKRILLVDILENKSSSQSSSSSIYNHPNVSFLDVARQWTYIEKQLYLEQLRMPNKLSDEYKVWHKQLTNMEFILLRQLGFTLYWIPDSHPHKFILYFCRLLELTDDKFSQRAWNYCNDSCRLDLCIRYEPQVIASSSILLAANDFDISLPIEPCPWWEVFIGKNSSKELVNAANAILGLVVKSAQQEKEDSWIDDSIIASKAYIKSLIPLGGRRRKNSDNDNDENENIITNDDCEKQRISFIDEGSFLWEEQKNLFELKKPTNV